MEKSRCPWCLGFSDYIDYHDREWGVPVHDDRVHFEFLVLEGAQAGLSWATILKKRAGYRKAFSDFQPEKIARFSEGKVQKLLQNPDIIRNQSKIRSTLNNARKFLQVQQEFGSFDRYIWAFTGGKIIQNHWEDMREIPATSPISNALSVDLKSRGFKFVGSTTLYAHLQACGLINDHLVSCFRYAELHSK